MKFILANDAMAGIACGSIIFNITVNCDAPSILAASEYALLIDLKYPYKTMKEKSNPPAHASQIYVGLLIIPAWNKNL